MINKTNKMPHVIRGRYTFITEPAFEIQKTSKGIKIKTNKIIIALLSKALLVITLIKNLQMFVKNFIIISSLQMILVTDIIQNETTITPYSMIEFHV